MQSLVKNLKLKRVVAMLLLVCTVMSTFLTSFSNVGVVHAAADSNTRRTTSINLAAGTKLTSIDDLSSIDEKSLRTIALYLSNFYIPFVSVLDGEWDEDDSTDSGNKSYETEMLNALTKNCGFDKETAQYLVNYTMAQSLNSCSDLLIKTDDLKALFKIVSFYDATWEGKVEGLTGVEMSPGFMGWGFADSDETSYLGANGINPAEHTHSGIGYGSADDYINAVGTVSDGTTDYVRISYALFLQLLDVTYAVASIDTFSGDHVDELPDASDFDTYSISNRDKGYSDGVPVINLYYLDGSNKAHIAFSNSEECMQAYALVNAQADYNHGYGSGFASVSNSDIEALTQDDYDATKGFVTAPNMCVNWVGDLVLDNGSYRTIVLPGCANPHMLTTMEDSGDNANTIPLQNIFAISNIVDASNNGFTNKELSFYTGSHSLFNLNYWRLQIGSADTTVDNDAGILWWSSHGKGAVFEDAVNNVDYLVTDFESASNDNFIFPSMFHIDKSKTYTESKSEKAYSQHSTLGYRDEYGHVVYNDNIIYTDSFKATTATDELKKYFPSENLFDIIDSLKTYNTNTYSQFSSVTSQGHAATYNQTTKSLFQSIYLSYCFACFNEEAGGSFSEDSNIINLKTNYGNFPSANEDIDWSTLATNSRDAEIKDFVYYLLHPTKGIGYVATLIKNKLAGVLLGWHDDIVGSTDSNSTTGMTKYLGTSSYTTTPSLYDVTWIAKILEYYNSIIVYLIILICLILLCYVLVGSMTLQRGIIGVLIFGFLAFLPPFAINGTTNIINKTSDKIFSKKFDYWAICQLETFIRQYQDAMDAQQSGDFADYAAFVISNNAVASDSAGGTSKTTYSGVKLKWMSPKKYNSTASLASALEKNSVTSNTSAKFLLQSVKSSVAVTTSGETFIDNDNALYLYRDYSDIYKYAHTSYNIATKFNYSGDLLESFSYSSNKDSVTYMHNDSKTSTYSVHNVGSHAWDGLSDTNLYNYVLGNDSTDLTKSDVYNESSSSKAISRGFMFNTIDWDFSGNRQSSDSDTTYSTYYWSNDRAGSRNTLALTYPMQFTATYREIHEKYKALQEVANGTKSASMTSGSDLASGYYNFGLTKATASKADDTTSPIYGSYLFGYSEIIGIETTGLDSSGGYAPKAKKAYKDLSDVFYGLYSESPFYFFNNNIRDQITAASKMSATYGASYSYGYPSNMTDGSNTHGDPNSLAKMFLADNQSYFYNLTPNAGDGYGELRDFTNMHDLFYYVIPYLKEGVDLSRLYDDAFGLYIDDDCSLRFKDDGSFVYDGVTYECLKDFKTARLDVTDSSDSNYMTEEEKYKFWHSYNTNTILLAYCSWVDTMMDCDYAKSETIKVMGEKFRVSNPLDPTTYFTVDADGNLTKGRFMVFSESEMKYYGLSSSDLTEVERKIISFQKAVYNQTLDLMNYQSVSNETLIQAYAMLQLFAFNNEFSQESVFSSSNYTLYPQGYELKAFSYDAYLRMIMSEASGESLMTDSGSDGEEGNTSIYKRIMDNTSLFYGLFLLLNDVIAVYLIPGLKLFFIICIFFTSILLILSAAIKLDLNIVNVTWKSLLAPLLSFAVVSIAMSFIVAMFMSSGANGITSSALVINTGDPTSALLLMIVLNAAVLVLYFKICKKCFADMKTYFKAVFSSIGSAVTGAFGVITGGLVAGKKFGQGAANVASRVATTAKQRGRDNSPKSGKSGLGAGGALAAGAAGALGAGLGMDALSNAEKRDVENSKNRANASAGMNRFDKKAFDGANARVDKQQAKLDKANRKLETAGNANLSQHKRNKLEQAKKRQEFKLQRRQEYANDVATMGTLRANAKRIGQAPKRATASLAKTVGRVKAFGNNVDSNLTRFGGAVKSIGNSNGRKQLGAKVSRGVKKGFNNVKSSVTGLGGTFKSGVNNYETRYTDKASKQKAEKVRAKAAAEKKVRQRNAKQKRNH